MKKKILIAIGIVIVIIVVMVLVRFSIYMDLNKKYDEMNAKDNYYYYSETDNTIMSYWKKGNIHKLNTKQVNGEGNITFWKNSDTNEYYMFNETKNKTYSKYIGNNGMMIENLPLTGYYVSKESRVGINLMFAINPLCTISNGKYEDKDCYILGYLEEGSSKEWIEKETGLPLYIEFANGTNRKIQYSFDTVTDEDVKMPNIEEYTNIQNDNKNYDINMKIAYENEEDKANSKLVYYNESNKDNYKWNECIIENKAILKNMPEVDFTQFKELGDEFYSIRISDYELYSKYANDYNLRKLDKSDFDNIFVEFIIRKSPDYSITYKDLVKGYDYISKEDNYTVPVTVSGILDVSEDFKYPCMIGYFPNYFNKDYNDIRFKILALNENIEINKDEAVTVAQQYLKNLTYAGCYNFTNMNYVRLENKYANNFFDTDKKIEPIDDTSKEYTVWSISAYSENDMCTSANVYIDVETGKIIGGKLYLATD